MQKYLYKTRGDAATFPVKPRVVPAHGSCATASRTLASRTTPRRSYRRLRYIPGQSRRYDDIPSHVARGLPPYYVALFVPRQIDDDLQEKIKYGEKAFNEYVARVPYRIVPPLVNKCVLHWCVQALEMRIDGELMRIKNQ